MAPKVVVTDHAFRTTSYERDVAEAHHAEFAVFQCTGKADTIAAVTGADVVFTNFAPIGRSALSAMNPGATVIRYGVGVDNVDLNAAREIGIRVANVPDYGVDTVADHAAAALLAITRNLLAFDHGIRTSNWVSPTSQGQIQSWRQHTVGFLGFGRIGQALHRRLKPFGARFVAYDPFTSESSLANADVTPVNLEELARHSTILSLHAPLTPETSRIIDADFLSRMPEGAVLVNTARGGLIHDEALVAALDSGHIYGAALDVFTSEPLPKDSVLRSSERILLTPHAAFYDEGSLDELQRLAGEEAGRALRGEELRCQVA